MINAQGTNQNQTNWFMVYRGVKIGQLFIPCQCITFISFLGFGLSLMGLIMTATSHGSKLDVDNPFRTVGPILLSIGLLFIFVSIILCIAFAVKGGQENINYASCQSGPVMVPQNNQYPPQPAPATVYPYPLVNEFPPVAIAGAYPPPNYYQATDGNPNVPQINSAYNPSMAQTAYNPSMAQAAYNPSMAQAAYNPPMDQTVKMP